jgi:hypothetical protein
VPSFLLENLLVDLTASDDDRLGMPVNVKSPSGLLPFQDLPQHLAEKTVILAVQPRCTFATGVVCNAMNEYVSRGSYKARIPKARGNRHGQVQAMEVNRRHDRRSRVRTDHHVLHGRPWVLAPGMGTRTLEGSVCHRRRDVELQRDRSHEPTILSRSTGLQGDDDWRTGLWDSRARSTRPAQAERVH